jgi:hypothetical protein
LADTPSTGRPISAATIAARVCLTVQFRQSNKRVRLHARPTSSGRRAPYRRILTVARMDSAVSRSETIDG